MSDQHINEIYTTRHIDHDEAREVARRLINSHFRQEPGARIGIPARPDYDDDLLMCAYIKQQQASVADRMAMEDRLRAENARLREALDVIVAALAISGHFHKPGEDGNG